MIRRSLVFARPCAGIFSHFAHFIVDFVLPFYSYLRSRNLLDSLLRGDGFTLELKDRFHFQLGPLHPIALEIFPGLSIEYVSQYSRPALFLPRKPWRNNPEHLDPFIAHLRQVLPLKPVEHKLIIVERGLDRQKYPGGASALRSGADIRRIGQGLDQLIAQVKKKRPDALHVVLEHLSFAEQVSLFLNADTMIAQHGAAFVHAHWMPKGGHLIELQCNYPRLCPWFVPTIAALRHHKASVVRYPCKKAGGCVVMEIGDRSKVTRLLTPDISANFCSGAPLALGDPPRSSALNATRSMDANGLPPN
jgi:hypothetical protein